MRRFKLYTLKEILEDNSQPPKPIIDDGLLLDGTILMIVAPAKHRKTFLAQNIALSIAFGSDFAGFKVPDEKKVLYFMAEGGYFPNRNRIQDMCSKYNQNLVMGYPSYLPINRTEEYEYLIEMIKAEKPDVLILDPLKRFHDVDENSASQMGEIFGRIRNIIDEFKISAIIVHHTGKVSSKGGRGSSVIMGEYDSCIEMTKYKDGNALLKFDMRHVETPPTRTIKFNGETLWFENQSGIVELIESAGGKILKKDLINLFSQSNASAYRQIDKAVKSGLIEKNDNHLVLIE
jgi:RecA-family ATPase